MQHISGLVGSNVNTPSSGGGTNVDYSLRSRVIDLERKLHRLELTNRVLWEMMRDGLKLTEAEMEKRVKAIDLRDGVADGKITEVPMRCPSCKRVSSSRHWKCLYCGQEFEKYVY
jgi:hypothetical protein